MNKVATTIRHDFINMSVGPVHGMYTGAVGSFLGPTRNAMTPRTRLNLLRVTRLEAPNSAADETQERTKLR